MVRAVNGPRGKWPGRTIHSVINGPPDHPWLRPLVPLCYNRSPLTKFDLLSAKPVYQSADAVHENNTCIAYVKPRVHIVTSVEVSFGALSLKWKCMDEENDEFENVNLIEDVVFYLRETVCRGDCTKTGRPGVRRKAKKFEIKDGEILYRK